MRRLIILIIFGLLIWSPGNVALGGELNLRLATFLPPNHISYEQVLVPFAKRVYDQTKGILTVDIYHTGELGRSPREQLDLVVQGVADIALVIPSYTPGMFPNIDIVGLPGLIENATEGSLALTRLYRTEGLRSSERIRLIGLFTTNPSSIHLASMVRGIGDLRGRKIRVGSRNLDDTLRAFGMSPVRLSGGEITVGLQTGAIDGVATNWTSLARYGIDEVAKYSYDFPVGAAAVLLVMNRYRYDSLPRFVQNAIDTSGGEWLARQWGRAYDFSNRLSRSAVEDSKENTIIVPSESDRSELASIAREVEERWVGKLWDRRELVDAFRKEIEAIRSGG